MDLEHKKRIKRRRSKTLQKSGDELEGKLILQGRERREKEEASLACLDVMKKRRDVTFPPF